MHSITSSYEHLQVLLEVLKTYHHFRNLTMTDIAVILVSIIQCHAVSLVHIIIRVDRIS